MDLLFDWDLISSRSPHSRNSFSRREESAWGEARRLEFGEKRRGGEVSDNFLFPTEVGDGQGGDEGCDRENHTSRKIRGDAGM